MPTGAKIYDDCVRKPNQAVVEHVELEGLTKLVAEGYSPGLMFVSPDLITASDEEKKQAMAQAKL